MINIVLYLRASSIETRRTTTHKATDNDEEGWKRDLTRATAQILTGQRLHAVWSLRVLSSLATWIEIPGGMSSSCCSTIKSLLRETFWPRTLLTGGLNTINHTTQPSTVRERRTHIIFMLSSSQFQNRVCSISFQTGIFVLKPSQRCVYINLRKSEANLHHASCL